MTDFLLRWCERTGRTVSTTLSTETDAAVRRLLAMARTHMGMDMTWLSQFSEGAQTLHVLDGNAAAFHAAEGDAWSLADSYCVRVLDGTLPSVIPNTGANPITRNLAITREHHLGAYVGSPVLLEDGKVYGMLCCVSYRADDDLRPRDAGAVAIFAHLIAEQIATAFRDGPAGAQADFRTRALAMLTAGGPGITLQPVLDTDTGRTVAAHAKVHFPGDRTLRQWSQDSQDVNCELELESDVVHASLAMLPKLPDGQHLGIDATPGMITSGRLDELLADVPRKRIVIQLSARAITDDHAGLRRSIEHLRRDGVLLAISAGGSGAANLRHIIALEADVVKLNRFIVGGTDHRARKDAVLRSMVAFAEATDTHLVAGGVTSRSEALALRDIGIRYVQGAGASLTNG